MTLSCLRLTRISSGLAISALLFTGCNDTPDENTPSYKVIVLEGQTLEDIGYQECGPSLLGISTNIRKNKIREFNQLKDDSLDDGQVLRIPESLCEESGGPTRKQQE
jgi:hypothetical protein